MTRGEWQQKARDFAASARVLLQNGQFDTAYYMAGMAVECALKARIAKRFKANTLPGRKLVSDIYRDGHDIARLAEHAELQDLLTVEARRSLEFQANWRLIRSWNVDSRYGRWSQIAAEDMVGAVTKRGTGMLSWIGRHW